MNGSKILAFRETFWYLFPEKLFDYVNILLWQTSLIKKKKIVENFVACRKFPLSSKSFLWKISLTVSKCPWLWKISWFWQISLILEKFLDQKKFPWLWKNSLTADNLLDFGKFPSHWKIFLIVENFLECGKISKLWKNSLIKKIWSTVKKFPDCRKTLRV